MIDLRLGKYQDVLADVECDAVICDPPYGGTTHDGNSNMDERFQRSNLDYQSWTEDDVVNFVEFWEVRTKGWMAVMTSDDLIPSFRFAYEKVNRLDFAPVPILAHRPRLGGDGPGSCAVYLMVSRPKDKRFMSWGSLRGWYTTQPDKTGIVNGGKKLDLMQAIIRDYSRPGDLICDPCAGGATTLIAAATQGRRAVGAEMDPDTYEKAKKRIEAGFTPDMFAV